MNGLRRVISNTIILFLGQGVNWISTLLLTIAYGHFLGAFKFGELYFAIAFVALIGVPVTYGYDSQAIRDVAQKPDKAAGYFSNLLLIRLGFWFILYALVLLASWLLGYSPEVRVLVAICGFDLLCNALASTCASLHYAFERAIFPAVGNILEKGLSALLGILLLRSGAGVQAMAVVLVLGSLINGVWQAAWLFRLVGAKLAIDLALIRTIVRTNIPFLINGVLLVGYTTIDTVLLGLVTNDAVVGWYGAAMRITGMMSFIPGIVITYIMFPIFSKLSLSSDADLKLAVEKSVNFLLFCGIPIATAMIVAAPNIIRFLYQRNEFSPSILVLQIAAPSVVFVFINYALTYTILSKKQDRKLPMTSAIALVFNLGLNLILILLYQHIGAAIASTLTEVLVCCIFLVFIPRHLLPFGSLRVALKALIASLVMALAILPLHTLHIFIIIPIAALVYVGVSVLIGVIPREDYQAVYRAVRRKARPTSRPSAAGLAVTPQPAYGADALLDFELATTMRLPAMQLQSTQSSAAGLAVTPQPAYGADALLDFELATTVELPAMRLQSMQSGATGLAVTPQPAYGADALLDVELATTMELPAMRLQSMQSGATGLAVTPQPAYGADALHEDGLNASAQKLRKKHSFFRPESGYRYIPRWPFRKFNMEAFSNNNEASSNSTTINAPNPADTAKTDNPGEGRMYQ
jgi:O-antigen/teichoic acid export membrane protein